MTLYRKYRPQQFKDVVGQDTICTILQQALLQDRVAHAYLFSGPRGTGKTSTARILARAVNCLKPTSKMNSFEPCDTCESCVAILNNSASDLIEIDAASNRGIEDIRELREQVNYHPVQLKRKVYVIDEVHMLTTEAFNALLKTLEEPPSYCLFILATTETHKVPLTIRSRCQSLRFERGSMDSLTTKLRQVAESEHIPIDTDALELLARHAEGGFRDAETLLESVRNDSTTITLEHLQKTLGLLPSAAIDTLLTACLTGSTADVTSLLTTHISPQSHAVERLIAQLITRLREELTTTTYPLDLVTYSLSQLMEAYILHKHAPIPALPLEIACLNIACRAVGKTPVPQAAVVPKPPKTNDRATAIAAPPAAVPDVVPKVEETKVPVIELREEHMQDLRKAWKMVIDRVCSENIVLGQALKDTVFHTADDSTITIHVRFKFHVEKMNEKKNSARIHDLLSELTGKKWEIHYTVNEALSKLRSKKELNASVDDAKSVFGT